LDTEKLQSQKSAGIDQIQVELIDELVEQFDVRSIKLLFPFGRRNCLRSGKSHSFSVSTRRAIKTDYSNYRGISFLPVTYKILSNILLSRLTQYVEEIIRGHQCRFRRNR